MKQSPTPAERLSDQSWPPRRAPSPAEACSELGFENESTQRHPRMGPVHGLERVLLNHPTAVTIILLVVLGIGYFAAVN